MLPLLVVGFDSQVQNYVRGSLNLWHCQIDQDKIVHILRPCRRQLYRDRGTTSGVVRQAYKL